MALQSNPSEWQTGESDPADFTADAVVEVLNSADEDEVSRVRDADERQSVQEAADTRLESLDSDEGDDDENTPDPDAVGEQTPPDDDDEDEDEEDWDDPEKADDDYDPFGDPNVPSSAIAQVIATELEGTGKSPTLAACRTGE